MTAFQKYKQRCCQILIISREVQTAPKITKEISEFNLIFIILTFNGSQTRQKKTRPRSC